MDQDAQLPSVADALRDIQQTQAHLLAAVESLNSRIGSEATASDGPATSSSSLDNPFQPEPQDKSSVPSVPTMSSTTAQLSDKSAVQTASPSQQSGLTSRIILTCVCYQLDT